MIYDPSDVFLVLKFIHHINAFLSFIFFDHCIIIIFPARIALYLWLTNIVNFRSIY